MTNAAKTFEKTFIDEGMFKGNTKYKNATTRLEDL